MNSSAHLQLRWVGMPEELLGLARELGSISPGTDYHASRTPGLLVNLGSLRFFASMGGNIVFLTRSSRCHSAPVRKSLSATEELVLCTECGQLDPGASFAWRPPMVAQRVFPDLMEEWISFHFDVLTATLIAPELVKRLDYVFKNKVLAPPLRRYPCEDLTRILFQAEGRLL